ncbi:MAG: hypothetical protein WD136_00030 [Cyanobium sp.]
MGESWSDPLEQRFDRLVSSGRQFVNGVSGARPGSRGAGRRPRGPLGQGGLPKLDGLGRWVENKLDWILEDEDDLREPWQEPQPQPVAQRRRPLEAISRRTSLRSTSPGGSTGADWPDDETFTVPRWQRQAPGPAPAPSEPSGRPLPRSTRRRPAG